MRSQPYNKEKFIRAFAEVVSNHTQIPQMVLLNDENQLRSLVSQFTPFPWDQVAAIVGLRDKWRVYHWYYETYQNALEELLKEDKELIRSELESAIQSKQEVDKMFQYALKQKLSREYDRTTFSRYFNNTRRILEQQYYQNLTIQQKLELKRRQNNTIFAQPQITLEKPQIPYQTLSQPQNIQQTPKFTNLNVQLLQENVQENEVQTEEHKMDDAFNDFARNLLKNKISSLLKTF
ncbi:Conserved_hypothetical protein [Hexamita inflata]|uniref:Uncharacterized protein n=1 Tax=Hexamita inflata TaxID=28002 RepID=A0AA86QCA7_9EUKA|nr:Conserved hypothetical protein [Hexamita inflata]